MVFEVDNTTEKLIQELHDNIQNTISGLTDGQEKIANLVQSIQLACDGLADVAQESQMEFLFDTETKKISKLLRAEEFLEAERVHREQLQTLQKIVTDTSNAEKLNQIEKTVEKQGKNLEEIGVDLAKKLENISSLRQEADAIMKDELREELRMRTGEQINELQTLGKNFHALAENLQSALDSVCTETQMVQKILNAGMMAQRDIIRYLSLPGYKRFFKGMVQTNEENE